MIVHQKSILENLMKESRKMNSTLELKQSSANQSIFMASLGWIWRKQRSLQIAFYQI